MGNLGEQTKFIQADLKGLLRCEERDETFENMDIFIKSIKSFHVEKETAYNDEI